jgi:uncharacterized iron-regulated membrane protein
MGTSARAFRPRAAFTWLHRYVGLAIAGFLIIASATGIPLAFNAELEALLSPELFRVAKQGRQTLTPDELIARVHRALPQLVVTGLNYRPGEHDSVRPMSSRAPTLPAAVPMSLVSMSCSSIPTTARCWAGGNGGRCGSTAPT